MIVTKWTHGALKTGGGKGGMDYINPLNQFISSQTGNERQINGPRTKDIKMTK